MPTPDMTLRDWFAGQALSGLEGLLRTINPERADEVAGRCYEFAEAMIRSRAQFTLIGRTAGKTLHKASCALAAEESYYKESFPSLEAALESGKVEVFCVDCLLPASNLSLRTDRRTRSDGDANG